MTVNPARILLISVVAFILFQGPDGRGKEAKESKRPIVSASLASDEILLALFPMDYLEANIVLSSFVDNPAYSSVTEIAAKLPQRWHNSAEALIASRPRLVILASYNHPSFKIRLEKAAVPFIELNNFNRLVDIMDHIRTIGSAVGRIDEANALIVRFQQVINDLTKVNHTIIKKPSLLAYSAMGTPGGKDTLIDDIIVHAGGVNLATNSGLNGWSKINHEILAVMNPDFIILSEGGLTRAKAIEQVTKDPVWKHFSAVKSQRFIFVNQAKLTSVSHHVLDAIKDIHQQILEHKNAKKN